MTHHIHHDEAVNIALLGDPAVRALVERAKVEERERIAQAIEAEAERRHAEVVAMWTEDDGTSMCDHKPGDACWHRHEDGCGSCGVAAAARIARADSLAAQPAPEEGCSSCGLYGGGHAHPDCEGAQPAPEGEWSRECRCLWGAVNETGYAMKRIEEHPYCPEHARCVVGHRLIILDDDPAFCPDCGHDVMPVGACKRLCGERVSGGRCIMAAGHHGPHGRVGLR